LSPKIVQVGVVYDIQTTGKLLLILVVAFGLLAQLQERFLYFDVRQRVDATELIDTHLGHLVFARHMRETVDDPCGRVITSVSVRVAGNIVRLRRQQPKVRSVDKLEDMLAPSNKILPSIDVVP